MSGYHENRKTISFFALCLNFSIETKIKILFLISHFNLSKNKTKPKKKIKKIKKKKTKTKWYFRYSLMGHQTVALSEEIAKLL